MNKIIKILKALFMLELIKYSKKKMKIVKSQILQKINNNLNKLLMMRSLSHFKIVINQINNNLKVLLMIEIIKNSMKKI